MTQPTRASSLRCVCGSAAWNTGFECAHASGCCLLAARAACGPLQAKLALLARDLGVELDDAELREAAVGLDTNRNGLIEFEELVAYWTH